MSKPIIVNRQKAIEIMEENLRKLKECSDTDTFLVLSYDLKNKISLGRRRLNEKKGKDLIKSSKTFILNEDNDEDSISTLSIYSEKQLDIFNIIPVGKKHDMILIPKLEWECIMVHKTCIQKYNVDKWEQMFYIRYTNKNRTDVRKMNKKEKTYQNNVGALWDGLFINKQNTRFRLIWDSSKSMWHAADSLRKLIITYSILKIKRFLYRFYQYLSVSAKIPN